ncbi:MAG: glycosyltransferase family 4 protein, partial [Acidimicrobiaceae bacterium]|nr:glycosyltransferase family 4 protein [Acidimicrobiaceae bacterium]
DVTVLTSPHSGADIFDAAQDYRVIRTREPVLLPQPWLTRRVAALVRETGAEAVVLDPALPLGHIGPSLDVPYAVVLHGAEVTIPARLPATRQALRRVLQRASLLIAAGSYPAVEARRAVNNQDPPIVEVPPGVDLERFTPVARIDRAATRARLRLPMTGPLVVSVSRLVPRKGMDTLIDAAALLHRDYPDLTVAIAGEGRDRRRLTHRIERRGAPVHLLGRVPDDDLPALYGCADVFALCCRTRWGGLEQEGFGIVFLEAAAAGVASLAGDSGGAAEAVVDGETGIVVHNPHDAGEVARALVQLIGDDGVARRQGLAARRRVEEEFGYDQLAGRLAKALEEMRRV